MEKRQVGTIRIKISPDTQSELVIEATEPYLHLPFGWYGIDHYITDGIDKTKFFLFKVKRQTDSLRVIAMVYQGSPSFRGKGLPEAMIRFVSRYFNQPVYSSRKAGRVDLEDRSTDACKVWNRLVESNEATFLPDDDNFVYPAK